MEEKINPDKAILAGLDAAVFSKEETATESTLEELKALLETAGGTAVGTLLQSRPAPDPHSFLGEGKVEELRQAVEATGANMVIFDNDLSPSQIQTLEDITGATVIDRSALILDIFAQRAKTREGRLQVELAQYQYLLPRLSGMGRSLSRQGGGIGTRGPGETKLEVDRRAIRKRINELENKLDNVVKTRNLHRKHRQKENIPVVALVGYTNAGKSTLLNTLTGAQVLEEDKLFATLDPTTRILELPSGQEILLTDTVGFIRKLPHHLIDAFRSTLEEAKYADIILHVVDASSPQMDQQMYVVYETLKNLGVTDKKIVTLFNKQDKMTENQPHRDLKAEKTVHISAKWGEGLEEVKQILEDLLNEKNVLIERFYDYRDAGVISLIRKYGQLLEEEYRENGIYVKAYVPMEIYGAVTPDKK